MLLLSVPMCYFSIINDPTTSWKLFAAYYSVAPEAQKQFQMVLDLIKALNNGIIVFYIFFPLAVLVHYYIAAQFRFKRRYAMFFLTCISLIDIYVNLVLLNGYFRSINYNQTELTKFPVSQVSYQAYILAPILATAIIAVIILLTFYYKPFHNFLKVRKKDLIKTRAS